MKQLKSFLGLAIYFRPHINSHSEVARSLHNMLINYHRDTQLKWTDDLMASFHDFYA